VRESTAIDGNLYVLLHRGISVPSSQANSVVDFIRAHGMQAGQGSQWSMKWNDLKPQLKELGKREKLDNLTKSGPSLPRLCGGGDELGARYYARHHNRSDNNDTAILISFEADVASTIVDGRDFLYTIFQFGYPKRARYPTSRIFGDAVLPYLYRAWATADQDERIARCDLAVQDDDVIASHARNAEVHGGRSGTRFCSAFMTLLPVPAARIKNVSIIRVSPLPNIDISLYNLLRP
jgi:hypothetical protein